MHPKRYKAYKTEVKKELPIQIDLTGKVAVVTGAGGALCGAFSEALAQCGAKVALFDINGQAAQLVADRIVKNGYAAKAYRADVLDKASVEQAYAR